MGVSRAGLVAAVLTAAATLSSAGPADQLPPPPARYFNDYASLVKAADADRLDAKLKAFDEQTSNQVVVAVFPELPSPSLEDFTIRTAQSWRAGREKLDNGVVLFVFVKDRRSRIEVGYGLEGALPDVTAKQILDDVMAPRFRAGDFAGGLEAAIDSVIAATRGEYKAAPKAAPSQGIDPVVLITIIVILFIVLRIWANSRGWATYTGGGWGTGGGWSSGGGGWSSGGGGWSGGGGGFSGGGGSFGGGGASGSW
jgi:uncharacterized protein